MERIIDLIIDSFDFGYMFTVNILTYVIIKTVDQINGPKKGVSQLIKRLIALISGIVLGIIIYINQGYSNMLLYSFITSLVSWDIIFKPIVKYFKNFDYNKNEDT